MAIELNGTTGITTPDVTTDSGASLTTRVAKTGDTMTGNLIVSPGDGVAGIYGYGLEVTRSDAYVKSSGTLRLGTAVSYNSLLIDTSGRVTMPYQPAFWAQVTTNYIQGVVAGLSIGTNNGWGINTHLNQGNHYNPATGIFTAPVAGVYVFGINDLYYASGGYIQSGITINGGQLSAFKYTDSTGTVYDSAETTITVKLQAGDTAKFYVTSNSSGSHLHGGGYNSMYGYLIG